MRVVPSEAKVCFKVLEEVPTMSTAPVNVVVPVTAQPPPEGAAHEGIPPARVKTWPLVPAGNLVK